MKNLTQFLFASILLISTITVLTSFTTVYNCDDIDINTETSGNSCTLNVKTSYGSAAKSVKVSTDVSGGVSCIGGKSFYADSDGEVTLQWSSGCYLKKIYVDGRGYNVDYKDGESYYLTMK